MSAVAKHYLFAIGVFLAYFISLLLFLLAVLFDQTYFLVIGSFGVVTTSFALYYKHRFSVTNDKKYLVRIIIAGAIGAVTGGFIGSLLIVVGAGLLIQESEDSNKRTVQ